MTSFARLHQRWSTAARFAATAYRWTDRLPLFLAGVARDRPFDGPSAYARFGRLLGTTVAPRLAAAQGHRLALDLRLATDLMVFEEIFLDGIYPLAEVSFVPDCVVDCGACAGFFTVASHGRWPGAAFHVFEPHPSNLERLRRNFSLNGIPATVHAAAVGDHAGTARFSGDGFGGHLAAADAPQTFEVVVTDLCAFLSDLRPQRLLLKIDIEGAEAGLLPKLPAVLPPLTTLFLETHQGEAVWREYIQPMLAAGFRHRVIRQRRDLPAGTDYVEHVLHRH